jgi:hypothetical protein
LRQLRFNQKNKIRPVIMKHISASIFLCFVSSIAYADNFFLGTDECIILVASTKSESDARKIQSEYPGSILYFSKSGYIAIGIEKVTKRKSADRIKDLLLNGEIPKGSNCADASRLAGLLDSVQSNSVEEDQSFYEDKNVSTSDPIKNKKRTVVPPPSVKTNLEKAISPYTSNLKKWNNFSEEGGLYRSNIWHGMTVFQAAVSYKTDTKKIYAVHLSVGRDVPVKKIRSTINMYCGFTDQSWERTVRGDYLSGTAENDVCRAVYVPDNKQTMGFSFELK